jgi:hypothetical protein
LESEDVTNLIIEATNKAIVKFISIGICKDTIGAQAFSYRHNLRIDSVEKSRIKLHNVSEYTDDIYDSFESFKEQIPDYSLFSITFEDVEIKEIKGKTKRVEF